MRPSRRRAWGIPMAEAREGPFGHEPPGVNTLRVVGTVAALGTLAAIALVAIWLALRYLVMPDYVQQETRRGLVPPAPRLQPSHAHRDLEALRARKLALLSDYAWTDKSHRFARIPIARAMQIYVGQQEAGKRGQGRGVQKPGLGTRDSGLGERKPAAGGSKPKTAGAKAGSEPVPAASGSAGRRP